MTQNHHAGGVAGACPDVDTLADLHAGVLDSTTATELRQHADTCAACTETLAALDATVMSLGALPEVEMPAELATRLDRAIAAESGRSGLGDDLTLAASPPAAKSNVFQLPAERPHQVTPNHHQQRPVTGATNVASLAEHREKRGGRGRLLLAAAAAAAVLGIGGTIVATQNDGGDATANQAEQSQTADAGAETRDDAQARPGQVQTFSSPKDVLAKGAIENDQADPQVAGKMAELAERNKCLSQIESRPTAAPEAVQAGEYGGKKAYAFVFPTGEQDTVEMIVVDAADCSSTLDTVTGPRD